MPSCEKGSRTGVSGAEQRRGDEAEAEASTVRCVRAATWRTICTFAIHCAVMIWRPWSNAHNTCHGGNDPEHDGIFSRGGPLTPQRGSRQRDGRRAAASWRGDPDGWPRSGTASP